jgi:hypothetical protein
MKKGKKEMVNEERNKGGRDLVWGWSKMRKILPLFVWGEKKEGEGESVGRH